MSNELVNIEDFQVPAYLQTTESSAASDLVTQDGQMPTISIKGKVFRRRVPGQDDQALPMGADLPVIILAADPPGRLTAKKFYVKSFDDDKPEAPDCASSNGVVPDVGVPNRQSDTCAACPKNAWGSAVDNQTGEARKGKACADLKNLLIVPSAGIAGSIYRLTVPPTSLSNLSDYGRVLAKNKIPMSAVVTKVNFDPLATQPKLTFTFGGYLSETDGTSTLARAESEEITALKHLPPEVVAEVISLPAAVQEQGVNLASSTPAQEQPAAKTEPDMSGWTDPAGSTAQEESAQEKSTQPPGIDVVMDKRNVVWNPDVHSTSREDKGPVFNSDGSFRRKRGISDEALAAGEGVSQSPPQETEASTTGVGAEAGSGDLSKVLSDWGA